MTDDERWTAVTGRDRSADGAFIYAVTTTGVYCRPWCASRRPRRENVRFFESSAGAERGGFRACKRCRPAHASAVPEGVLAACQRIDEADSPPSLDELAATAGVSASALSRQFKAALGLTPKQYAAARRAERLKTNLAEGVTVTAAIYAAGYGSGSRVYETAKSELGMTPGDYRTGGGSKTICFAVAECSLGWVSVGATAKGVCLIELGDGPDELRAGVARRFPRAAVVEGGPEFGEWVRQVVAQVDGAPGPFALPVDVAGTAFQRRVWQALRAIPVGRTASYAEVAASLGQPGSARAVAEACAANPLAVVVPCHRVVRAGGAISGYRWGVGRKEALLLREAERRLDVAT